MSLGSGSCSFSLTSRIVRLVGIIREWANKNFREEEPRPDSFLERFRGPELQTVITQQGDGKGDKDGKDKGTKYSCSACGAQMGSKHAMEELTGISMLLPGAMTNPAAVRRVVDKGDLQCFQLQNISIVPPTASGLLAMRTSGVFSCLSCLLPDVLLLHVNVQPSSSGQEILRWCIQGLPWRG